MTSISSESQRFGRFTLSTLAARVIELVLGGVTGIILARVLGPTGKGNLTLLLTIPTLVFATINMSVGISLSYHSGKENQDDVIVNGFVMMFILGLFGTLITTLFVLANHSNLFPGIEEQLIVVALILVFLVFLYQFITESLLALYRVFELNVVLIIRPTLYLGLVIILVVVKQFGIFGALLATGAGFLLTIVAGFIILKRYINFSIFYINLELQRKIISYGLKVHVGKVLQALSSRLDYFIIAIMLDTAAVGYYSLATSLGEMLLILPASVQEVLIPRLMRYQDENRDNLVRISNRMVLFFMVLTCISVAIIGKPLIIFLYGVEFSPSYNILVLLLPGVLAYSSSRLLGVDINALGKPLLGSLASGVALVILVVFDLIAIPQFGIIGAAWGYSLAYLGGMLTILLLYTTIKNSKIFDLLIPKAEDFQLMYRVIRDIFSDTQIVWKSQR